MKDIESRDLFIFRALRGSRLHGTNVEGSDYDYFDVYLNDMGYYLSTRSLEPMKNRTFSRKFSEENDLLQHEFIKFITLLKKGNPNCIEFLFNEEWVECHQIWKDMQAIREEFLSKAIITACVGMARSDMKNVDKYGERGSYYYNSIFSFRKAREILKYRKINIKRDGIDKEYLQAVKQMNLTEAISLLATDFEANETFGAGLSSVTGGINSFRDLFQFEKSVFEIYEEKYGDTLKDIPDSGLIDKKVSDILFNHFKNTGE